MHAALQYIDDQARRDLGRTQRVERAVRSERIPAPREFPRKYLS